MNAAIKLKKKSYQDDKVKFIIIKQTIGSKTSLMEITSVILIMEIKLVYKE